MVFKAYKLDDSGGRTSSIPHGDVGGGGGGGGGPLAVAVKTYDSARCAKFGDLARSREIEIAVLRRLREHQLGDAQLGNAQLGDAQLGNAQLGDGHPHIANMLAEISTGSATHLILEYCAGGSLDFALARLRNKPRAEHSAGGYPEDEAAALLYQVTSGLAHLHRLAIAHRDLKPSNLLFVDAQRTRIKICDFGCAVVCGNRRLRERVIPGARYQSPEVIRYQAPELCRPLPNLAEMGYLGPPVDLWALGAVALEVLETAPLMITLIIS